MDLLPIGSIVRARTVEEVIRARSEHPESCLLGGGTDLIVNIRRGILAPRLLIDINAVDEMRAIKSDSEGIVVGAATTLSELAAHTAIANEFAAVAQAAGSIAGPTHRNMGTLGGNLCLDTRCIYYNQSEWWRGALNHCLKTSGSVCHVAPGSRSLCFATFSGDLAPAFMLFDAEVELAGPAGRRKLPLKKLYIGHARQDQPPNDEHGDGRHYLSLRPGEFIVSVCARAAPGWRSGYDKIRVRRSIEYPVAGVGVALIREGDRIADLRVAITGTNPRPILIEGTEKLRGRAPDRGAFDILEELVRDQVMSMKTTFTPGHYRRRMAGVLARRLVAHLFEQAMPRATDS
jgi:4-hydroxybenzoyl-CoA reductase subunit beta